jgi:epoxyqueuosine reductase
MDLTELKSFAEANGISRIGWFKASEFTQYLQAIEERTEYHKFDYRPYQTFLNSGRLPKNVKTIVTLAVDYFYENKYENNGFKISNYSRFCWYTLAPKANMIVQFLKDKGYYARNMYLPARRNYEQFADYDDVMSMVEEVDFPARAAACRAGIGFVGKNCMFYAHGLGSYVAIGTIGTDLELADGHQGEEQIKTSICANCNKCIDACPTKAISPEGYRINPFRCLAFINRHADEPCIEMPEDTLKLHRWLHGCEICQDVCPLNVKIKHKKEVVFPPEIDLYGMTIPNVKAVSEDVLRANMKDITSVNYYQYVQKLLGDDG